MPETRPRQFLYVENTYGGDVSVIDTRTDQVVATHKVGEHIDDIVTSPDGAVLYVVRQDTRDVAAVDAVSGAVRWTVPLTGLPHHIARSGDGSRLYVAVFNEVEDNVIDTGTRSVIARPVTGFGSHGVAFSPSGGHVLVGSLVFDQLAMVSTDDWTVDRALNFDQAVRPFCLTADESVLYVQLSRKHGFLAVDPRTGATLADVQLPGELKAEATFPHTADHGLELAPDGSRLLAAATTSGFVAVFDVPGHRLLGTIETGREPGWITFGADPGRCYVSNRGEDTVSVLDLATLSEAGRIPVGHYPQRMASGPAAGRP